MSLPVHLVPSLAGARTGSTVEVTGDEAHHAVAVRRLRAGEPVALTDGLGTRALGTVAATGKRSLSVRVASVESVERPVPELVVVQAIPKGERADLAVEVLTEVGADRIVPWAAARCVAVWRGERADRSLARWRSTAREAAKQARRAWFPEVPEQAGTAAVGDLVAEVMAAGGLAVVLHEAATTPLVTLAVPAPGPLLVAVGPEGGLTDAEVETLAARGAVPCRLGAEVLRTSTAGAVAVAALLARTPRWS